MRKIKIQKKNARRTREKEKSWKVSLGGTVARKVMFLQREFEEASENIATEFPS